MRISTTFLAGVTTSLLLLAGCGDDDAFEAGPATSDGLDPGGQDVGDGSTDADGGGESDVVVTVDGTEYPVSIVQECQTERDEGRSTELAVYGFAESASGSS